MSKTPHGIAHTYRISILILLRAEIFPKKPIVLIPFMYHRGGGGGTY